MDEPPQLSGGMTGIFIAAIVSLAGVVGYLFKRLDSRSSSTEKRLALRDAELADKDKAAALERVQCDLKIEKLRSEYEEKNKELAEKYAQDLHALYEDNRDHEDKARQEFAEIMENVSAKAGESSKSIVDMLQKFYERFVGGPGPRGRY